MKLNRALIRPGCMTVTRNSAMWQQCEAHCVASAGEWLTCQNNNVKLVGTVPGTPSAGLGDRARCSPWLFQRTDAFDTSFPQGYRPIVSNRIYVFHKHCLLYVIFLLHLTHIPSLLLNYHLFFSCWEKQGKTSLAITLLCLPSTRPELQPNLLVLHWSSLWIVCNEKREQSTEEGNEGT